MKAGENQSTQEVQVKELGTQRINLYPLRSEGKDALDITGFEAITAVRLRLVQISYFNTFLTRISVGGDDLFAPRGKYYDHCARIRKTGLITGALLDFHFHDLDRPIRLGLYVPHRYTLPRDSHAELVERWLARSHFTRPAQGQSSDYSYAWETPGAASKNFPA